MGSTVRQPPPPSCTCSPGTSGSWYSSVSTPASAGRQGKRQRLTGAHAWNEQGKRQQCRQGAAQQGAEHGGQPVSQPAQPSRRALACVAVDAQRLAALLRLLRLQLRRINRIIVEPEERGVRHLALQHARAYAWAAFASAATAVRKPRCNSQRQPAAKAGAGRPASGGAAPGTAGAGHPAAGPAPRRAPRTGGARSAPSLQNRPSWLPGTRAAKRGVEGQEGGGGWPAGWLAARIMRR